MGQIKSFSLAEIKAVKMTLLINLYCTALKWLKIQP